MKIAVAQISCALGDPAANVEKIRSFCERAKIAGAELILFPEMADTGYAMPAIQQHASSWNEGAVPALREIARSRSLVIVCGVSERDSGSIYNSLIVIDGCGEIAAKYRKTHLFAPKPVEEHKCFAPGSDFTTVDFGKLRFGCSICYDLRFPELYRALAIEKKANVFLVSSAWPFPRAEHLRILATARAIENQSYLILANQVGKDDGGHFCGGSAIIDPAGVIVAGASSEREELLQAEVSSDLIDAVRGRMPVFAHRRADLYGPPGAPR